MNIHKIPNSIYWIGCRGPTKTPKLTIDFFNNRILVPNKHEKTYKNLLPLSSFLYEYNRKYKAYSIPKVYIVYIKAFIIGTPLSTIIKQIRTNK